MFRYTFTVARSQYLRIPRCTSLSCMHKGTLRNMTEQVKMQNFGSEGWGFESLQARVSPDGTLAVHVALMV
jgi:hypothetical protein